MADQTFSAENFRRIWDLRVRRGENLVRLFPELAAVLAATHQEGNTSGTSANLTPSTTVESSKIADKESILELQLSAVAAEVNRRIDRGDFGLRLRPSRAVKGKPTYTIDRHDPATYFICRQIEQNIKLAFALKSPDRRLVTDQLFWALNDKTRKTVVRTDIKAFFESIPHDKLRELLRRSTSLSRTTSRFIDALLSEHQQHVGVAVGLPRGLGISTVLAETYLSQLDVALSSLPNVTFFTRYVDDIVLVFSDGNHQATLEERKKWIRQHIRSVGLGMNSKKTQYVKVSPDEPAKRRFVTYLGYEYDVSVYPVQVDISRERLRRYQRRIELSLDAYRQSVGDFASRRILLDRMKFMTTNTRLSNNKRQALVGIYFSNSLIELPTKRIHSLDMHLQRTLEAAPLPVELTKLLKDVTFTSGFENRKYSVYSPKRLQQIVKIWKYDD